MIGPITFRPASMDDAERLLAWRNDPATRLASISRTEITLETHLEWLAAVLEDPERRLLILLVGGAEAGVLRFDRRDGDEEISITLAPEFRGQGLAVPAIMAATSDGRAYVARIRRENAASLRAFVKCGFVVQGGEEEVNWFRKPALGEGPYRIMPRAELGFRGHLVRAVEPQDIEAIRGWRNAQMAVLRQARAITADEQSAYFAQHIWPDKARDRPRNILLTVVEAGRAVAYGGLVHIDWDYGRAEVSFLETPDRAADVARAGETWADWLRLMQGFAFGDLGLERLTIETYATRPHYIAGNEATGFAREGVLRGHAIVDGQRVDSLVHGILATDWRKNANRPATTGLGHVLVTSASRKVPLVRAMQDVLGRLGVAEDKVIAGDSDAYSLSRYIADGFWQMPRLDARPMEDLARECAARGITTLFPTRDGELLLFSQSRALFAAQGIEVIVSPPEGVQLCLDKLAFAEHGAALGLPVIPASLSPSPFGDRPLAVKERFGAGSRGIGLGLLPDEAARHATTLAAPIYQPMVAGPEISIDAYVARGGKLHGLVMRRRDRVVSGESQVTTTFRDHHLEAQTAQVLAAYPLFGPVVMQAIVTDSGLQVIEVNARFGGASTAGIAAGLDTLYWALWERYFPDRALPPFERVAGEIRQIRVPQDIVLHDPDL